MRTRFLVTALHVMIAIGVLTVERAAYAVIGMGTLRVEDAAYPYTEGPFLLQVGVPYVVVIENVWPDEIGGFPVPATIPVWVKSSYFGNTMHTATRWSDRMTYWFGYTPPAISEGGPFDACGSATVSYGNGGAYDARSVCLGPGWWCQAYPWAGEIRFVNAAGAEIPCPPTGVNQALWSRVKQLYR